MKRITASIIFLLAGSVPALAAETSLPDAYPSCMDRNGPDCVMGGRQVVPPRAAPGTPITPTVPTSTPGTTTTPGVVVIAPADGTVSPGALPAPAAGTVSPGAPQSPAAGTMSPGTVTTPGMFGNPAPATDTSTTRIITPTQGATIISPRKK